MTQVMSRRQALLLALTFSLTAGGSLALSGCGSGGGTQAIPPGNTGGGGPAAPGRAQGQITLPAGVTLDPAALRLLSAMETVAPAAGGAFDVRIPGGGVPVLVSLQDGNAGNKAVLLGFVAPDSTTNTLDATSAATALLYLALGGHFVPVGAKADVLRLIKSDPATTTFAQTIASRMASDPYALDSGDAVIAGALKAAYDAMTGGSSQSAAAADAAAQGRSRQEAVKPLLLVQPTDLQSGVEVLQTTDSAPTVQAVNHWRRECKVFVYKTGYEDGNGTRVDLPRADPVNLGDSLTATSALGGVVTTLLELISGTSAFVPVQGTPVPLTMQDGAAKTFFDILVVGSAFTLDEPAFFSEPRYVEHVAGLRDARGRLNLISWLRDIALGLLLEIWGIRTLFADVAMLNLILNALEAVDDIALQVVLQEAKQGAMIRSTKELLEAIARRDLLVKVTGAFEPLLEKAGLLSTQLVEQLTESALLRVASIVFSASGIVLGLGDLGAVVHDLASANAGDRWQATLVKPLAVIKPSTITLGRGQSKSFTASAPGATGKMVYQWSVSGSNLVSLRDSSSTHTGLSFESDDDTVTLTTTPSAQGTLTVAVRIFAVAENGTRSSLGDATAAVTMVDTLPLTVVYEDVPSGVNAGTTSFFLSFPVVPESDLYKLALPGNTYEIIATRIGAPVPRDIILNADAPHVPVHQTSGNRYANDVYHRGDNLYWAVITTTPGPDNDWGATKEAVAQTVAQVWIEGGFTVTIET